MLESAQLYSYIQILTINIMEHFYNCISSVFTKLAEKPLQSMFSLILLLIFAQSSQEQKDQILQVILEYIQEPTKSYCLPA